MKTKTLLVSSFFLILIINITFGIVHSDNFNEFRIPNKVVKSLCKDTDDHKLCHDVLYPVKTSNPIDYIDVVVKNLMESVENAFNDMSNKLSSMENNESNNLGIKMALEDCKDMLQFAINELKASKVIITESSSIRSIHNRSVELKNLFGAVIAYQQSCLDGFSDTKSDNNKAMLHLQTDNYLDNVGKLTGLALDVVSEISHSTNVKSLVDNEGYPTWFSVDDRKLMAMGPIGATDNDVLVTVAKDGSGQYKTIVDAINAYPNNHQGRYIIYTKSGVYDEYIFVDKDKPNVFMFGDGPTKTIITGSKSFLQGIKTMRTATFCKFN